MTEQDLPPECLDDDPPQHCYFEVNTKDMSILPEAGLDIFGIVTLALAAIVLGCAYMVVWWLR